MAADDGGLSPEGPARRHRVRARIGGALATTALLTIVGSWVWLGTTSPIVTVQTGSMVPTLHVGDVALMGSLRGRAPRVGEIVVEPVPRDVQQQLHYPAEVTHRVIEIKNGMVTTKGDANAVPEPFSVPVSKIHTRLVTVIPGAGRFLRFLVSPFGIVWLVFGGVLFLGPKILDLMREGIVPLPTGTADAATLGELVLAVREYGQHLQSHTAIVQAMAEASQQLSAVTARLEAGAGRPPLFAPPPAPAVRRPAVEAVVRPTRPVDPGAISAARRFGVAATVDTADERLAPSLRLVFHPEPVSSGMQSAASPTLSPAPLTGPDAAPLVNERPPVATLAPAPEPASAIPAPAAAVEPDPEPRPARRTPVVAPVTDPFAAGPTPSRVVALTLPARRAAEPPPWQRIDARRPPTRVGPPARDPRASAPRLTVPASTASASPAPAAAAPTSPLPVSAPPPPAALPLASASISRAVTAPGAVTSVDASPSTAPSGSAPAPWAAAPKADAVPTAGVDGPPPRPSMS